MTFKCPPAEKQTSNETLKRMKKKWQKSWKRHRSHKRHEAGRRK
jgi:hypothetical protein